MCLVCERHSGDQSQWLWSLTSLFTVPYPASLKQRGWSRQMSPAVVMNLTSPPNFKTDEKLLKSQSPENLLPCSPGVLFNHPSSEGLILTIFWHPWRRFLPTAFCIALGMLWKASFNYAHLLYAPGECALTENRNLWVSLLKMCTVSLHSITPQ